MANLLGRTNLPFDFTNTFGISFGDWRIKMKYVLFDKNEKDWQMVY